nr:zinc finger, CCHC-type [Tanacetum cinerariifolium]
MDSGDSYHITYTKDYLVDFKEYDGGNILLGDGRECRVRGTCKVPVQMRDASSFVLNNVRQEKVIKGSLVVSSGTRRANCVYTLDSQAVTIKTLKARKQLGEYHTRWKINTEDTIMSTYLVNRSPSSAIEFKKPVDMNMGFNESEEYKTTFIGSCVGMSSVQVLQGAEFQVEPQEDHKFEVKSHGNVDHVVNLQEVQTYDLIYHHSTLLEGHSILSLEVSISRDCDVENNASASVDMLNEFDYGLQMDVHGFVNFDYTMGRSITRYRLMIQGYAVSWEAKFQHTWAFSTTEAEYVTLTEMVKEGTWLKGLSTESKTELKLVAVFATGAFIKAGPWFEIPA